MDEGYYRCRACRGFYETTFAACKWCRATVVVTDAADGLPRVFPNRDTVRAIQIAEYEQLPPEAHADFMKPPADRPDLLCGCLHCGQEGHAFEAIEMRWLPAEQLWACPCPTCGGRGFTFDVHPLGLIWQCAQCDHWYEPESPHPTSARCPKCGCRQANGWFEVDDDEAAAADTPLDAGKVDEDDANDFDPAADEADDDTLVGTMNFDDDEDDDRSAHPLEIEPSADALDAALDFGPPPGCPPPSDALPWDDPDAPDAGEEWKRGTEYEDPDEFDEDDLPF